MSVHLGIVNLESKVKYKKSPQYYIINNYYRNIQEKVTNHYIGICLTIPNPGSSQETINRWLCASMCSLGERISGHQERPVSFIFFASKVLGVTW